MASQQSQALPASIRPRRSPGEGDEPLALTVCAICLRVRRGSEWVEAEQAIRALRSFELRTPPLLLGALCDPCVHSLRVRRTRSQEPIVGYGSGRRSIPIVH